eukprot:m.293112 g.293112  ORF g.293112 m.293112 type:complete len:580 (+) comp19490_c0_seq6:455-2194(+)
MAAAEVAGVHDGMAVSSPRTEARQAALANGFATDGTDANDSGVGMGDGDASCSQNHDATSSQTSDSKQTQPQGVSDTNLLVNYVPRELSEEQLHQLFARAGPLKSCRIIIDRRSGRRLGYAFVEYSSPDDALTAVSMFDGHSVLNKTLRVCFARPSSQDMQKANVYVQGLPEHASVELVTAAFAQFGDVVNVRLLRHKGSDRCKGVGFVRFAKRAEADAAIEALNRSCVFESSTPVTVEPVDLRSGARRRRKHQAKPAEPMESKGARKVASVKRAPVAAPADAAPNHASRESAALHVAQAQLTANPTRVSVARHHQLHPRVLQQAPELHVAHGRPMLPCHYATPLPLLVSTAPMHHQLAFTAAMGPTRPTQLAVRPGVTLFVSNLGPHCDERLLYRLFAPFGAVTCARPAIDPRTRLCKGFAVITMTSYQEAMSAQTTLNGRSFGPHILKVELQTAAGEEFRPLGMSASYSYGSASSASTNASVRTDCLFDSASSAADVSAGTTESHDSSDYGDRFRGRMPGFPARRTGHASQPRHGAAGAKKPSIRSKQPQRLQAQHSSSSSSSSVGGGEGGVDVLVG